MICPPRRQGGATLLVTLIMLVMLTLLAVSAMTTSTTNLKVVGNMQARAEAFATSQGVIETTISTIDFSRTPTNAIANPCGVANTVCTDLNADGIFDLTTQLNPAPRCVQARPIMQGELQITGPTSEDVGCLQAQQQGVQAVAGATNSGASLCGRTVWNISAQTLSYGATPANSEVNVTSSLGVDVRMRELELATSCP